MSALQKSMGATGLNLRMMLNRKTELLARTRIDPFASSNGRDGVASGGKSGGTEER